MVRRTPYSVVLFDEIEKAHPDVFNMLLQILEDGILTDSQGRKVDFKNTVIIMTSNVGAKKLTEKKIAFGFGDGEENVNSDVKNAVLSELKNTFRPEFLNRIDDIIVFLKLNKDEIGEIADKMIENLKKKLENLNISQASARDKELLILQERIGNLTTFKTQAVSLYGEIASAVTNAQTAFNNLSTILENAKSTKDEINSVVSKTTTTKTTTTTSKVKTTSSENAGSIIKNGVKLSKYHDGGIVGTGKELPENLIALTDVNLAPNETIAKLLNGEVVLNQIQMGNMFDNLGRAYSSLITPLNKRENSSMEITIGDVNVYNPSNTDMIVDEIVKELPLKVVQRLHSK